MTFVAAVMGCIFAGPVSAQEKQVTQLWQAVPIAAATVGESSNGQPWQRKIDFGVIAPKATQGEQPDVTACLKNALSRKDGQGRDILAQIQVSIDTAFNRWSELIKDEADDVVRDDAEKAKIFGARVLETELQHYRDAVELVQRGLRDADLKFRLSLAKVARCNALSTKSYLTLVHRVCPAGTECVKSGWGENKGEQAKRFDMLIAWALAKQGNTIPETLLEPDKPIMIGLASAEADAKAALGAFSDTDDLMKKPTPKEALEGIERLLDNRLIKSGAKLPATTLLVAGAPTEFFVRLSQRDWVERAEFGVSYTKPDTNSVLSILSDEIARRRIVECATIRAIKSTEVTKLKDCSGYNADAAEFAKRLDLKSRCAPHIAFISNATSVMADTKNKVKDLSASAILPRLRTAGLTFEQLAAKAGEACKTIGVAGVNGPDASLSKCLLTKSLGDEKQKKLAECFLSPTGPGAPAGELGAGALAAALACYSTTDLAAAANLEKAKAGIECLSATGDQLSACLVRLGGSKEVAAMNDCLLRAAGNDKLKCFLGTKMPGDAKVAQCATQADPRACLIGFLTPTQQTLFAAGQKCAAASSTAAYLDCAADLGINIDPKVKATVQCAVAGSSWQAAGACIVGVNNSGPIADAMACYADNAAAGGATGVAACVGARALNFNEDLQMLTQCAASTGGEPASTATCTFGKLALRELGFCANAKFGEEKCFGANNTLVRMLGIGKGSVVATVIDKQLDLARGVILITQNPGEAVDKTLRNAGNEISTGANNVYKEYVRVSEQFRNEMVAVLSGGGSLVKMDSRTVEIGPAKFEMPGFSL